MRSPKYPTKLNNMFMEINTDHSKYPFTTKRMDSGYKNYIEHYSITNKLWTQTNLKENTRGQDEISSDEESNNLFKSIQAFLIFGKVIGVLPFSGIFGKSWKDLSFRKSSITALLSWGITVILMFNAGINIVQSMRAPKRNALEIANSMRPTMFSVWGCFIYIYFLRHGQQFLDLMHSWNITSVEFCKPDITLRRDTFLIGGVILLSGIFENVVLHLQYFTYFDQLNGRNVSEIDANRPALETYYWRAHSYWGQLLGYHSFLAVIGFIQHKWNLYSVNYMDAMIAVFGRALYFRFKSLCKEAESRLLKANTSESSNISETINTDSAEWLQAALDHQNLCKLLDQLENFFSPITFVSYALNLFYLCVQLYDGLTNDSVARSIIHSIYTPWSFIHLVMRAFIVSICCARINVYAHRFGEILRQCPIEIYTREISRLDKRIAAGPAIGLTGLGCFTVTKNLILSMLSVVFTFEIVLLQADPNSTPPPVSSKC